MAVPTLKLDLAPPSTFWRLNHAFIGWTALAAGALLLVVSAGVTLRAYRQASNAGREEGATRAQTRHIEESQQKVVEQLRNVDVAKELPKWRLAERIYSERALPWSRLTAELERSMVPDVRLKSLQRTRGSDLKVQIKVKGEARTREAEAEFVEALQKNAFFEQVILEREGERQGGGVEFEYTLAVLPVPPPYKPLPQYGPASKLPPKPVVAPPKPPVPAARPVVTRPPANFANPARPTIPIQRPPVQAPAPRQMPLAAPIPGPTNAPAFPYPPQGVPGQYFPNRPPRPRPQPGNPNPGGGQ